MISNSITTKLKASKSFQQDNNKTSETVQEDDETIEEDTKTDKDHVNHVTNNHVMVFSPRTTPKVRGLLEFRPGPGGGGRQNENDRRSTTTRGGKIFSYSRITDYRTPSSRTTKFQESLNRNNSTTDCIQHHSKHFIDNNMDNKNKLDSGYNNLPDDPRISKMLRKLCVETDQERSIAICHKLLDTLMFPDNAKYIRRAFDILADTLLEIIKFGPCDDTRYLAARALGRIGYIMENDYKYFLTWLIKEFTKNRDDEIKILLIKSLIETYSLERTHAKLYDFATLTLNNIISQVEYAERPELFMALIDVVLMITECYPNEVNSHFRDVVDILVGWLVESNHSPEMADYASRSLQRLGVHWQTNILFSIQLLAQFLEDLIAFSEAFNSSGSSTPLEYISPKIETSLNQVTALTRVINTVLKCLGTCLNPSNSSCITLQFLTDCFINIVSTATKTLDKYLPENLIIAANESAYILLGYIQSKSIQANEFLYNLIDIELSLTQDFSDATLVSMLLLISQTIKEVAANLPIELVQKLLGDTSEILKLRNSPSINVQTGVVSVYHSLLNLKNIPLLQEAYRYVLGDLERSYLILLPNLEPFCTNNPMTITYNESEAEITTLFLLRCLSDLANASSSIIGMWALRPSILELLAVQLKPFSYELGLNCPSLQHAILYLLYSHCKRYNHFVSSSNLVFQSRTNVCDMLGLPLNINLGEGATSSPTSGHLTIILDVLTKTLLTQTCVETKCLILQWSKEIINLSESYYETLYSKTSFMEFTEAITQCGFDISYDIITKVYETLSLLLSNSRVKWSMNFLIKLSDLCALHMSCVNEDIRGKYSILSTKIPWNIFAFNIEKQSQLSKIKRKYKNQLPHDSQGGEYNKYVIHLAHHLHISRSGAGNIEMHTQNFKKFMSYLLFGHEHEVNWLENILNSCWPLLDTIDLDDYVTYFGSLAQINYPLLIFWITFEAANFCVNNKLRTPLGKPTDTFTSIESSIKKLAREITQGLGNERKIVCMKENKRVRILMEFMEHLEKNIYNASEGCATAMSQPSKPVRTFFHTNASTCREWFSRIRIAITVVALHAGLSPMAIRHAQALLSDLANAENTQGVEFERAVLHLAWGYLNLNESEALQGLYVWCSTIAKRKFPWLKTAAEQASKKYENAAKAYESILESEIQQSLDEKSEDGDESKNKNDSKQLKLSFISDQVTECYRKVNCWNDLAQWKIKEHELLTKFNQNGGLNKYTLNSINADYAQTLFEFEENDFVFLGELTKWEKIEKSCENSSWSTYCLLQDVETDLYECALNLQRPDVKYENFQDNLTNAINITQVCIQEKLRNLPSEFLQNSVFLNQIATCMKNTFLRENSNLVNTINICTDEKSIREMNSNILSKILWWSECFNKVKPQNTHLDIANLRLDVARAARKEGNFNLARKQIQKYFDLKKDLMVESKMNEWAVLENISKTLIDYENLDVSTWTLNNARAFMEAAKLLYVSHENKELALFLCAVTSFGVSQRITMSDCSYELRERGTRMLLTLAKWVQIETNYVADISNPLGRFITLIPEIGLVEQSDHTDIIPIQDMAVGKILQFASNQCGTLAKVWFTYGSWCYRWGRKMVDHSSESSGAGGGTGGGTLSESDRDAIKNLMPIGTSLDDLQNVYQILSQTRAVADEDDIGSNDINTSEMIEAQLRSVPILSNAYPEHLLMLVNIWRQAQKRVYSYYDLSANAYFKYLELYSTTDLLESGECTTITATLRLLRLIVKHALELQTVLESGLATTPTQPWKAIIPQLFSRLNHPEGYVRRRVSELLCRVAKDAPHLITFPAVVGAVQGGVNQLEFAEMKDYLSQNDNEIQDFDDDEDVTNNVLNSCFMSMVETLSKQTPETITQVQLLVKELRRITLLWDELWLGTLLQHNNEIVRRLTQLEQEILRVMSNINLTKEEKDYLVREKHRILTKPIIFILEQLHSITSITPETPNEKLFQERFNTIIIDVIEKLKNPLNPNKPKESWQPLKVLQTKLQQKSHKRASYTLKMSDISPILAQMHDTVIAMPGLRNNNSKQLITIMSVDNHVSILPTKTKPKKLIFHGSDGQTYTYLFKGLEDLHLDERIMQFLSIANTMLAKSSENNNVYRAKHYSVIPLGPRSGLISWVDGVTPVFALYKRWQQRAATKASLKQNSSQTTVLRPSELFYNKLNPLLKEHGVKNIDNRKEWPVSVLKQVLTELMTETPDDLLARELWCHSTNTGAWWQNVRNYSFSVAVMSIIGYIIGLGDRHLDNVLVDLSSGEVVHIDYNVCFEKGKTLRVPEKVPFRMTPNIRAALGVTGVEGIFRLACEHVLRTMKKGRETLLTLLEAFVYDPLVDWTVGGESVFATTVFGGSASTISTNTTKQSRRELEREVTTAMFNVRCAEMKTEWLNNKTDMENQITVVIQNLKKWIEEYQNVQIAEEALQDLHQQMAIVKEAEANIGTGKHSLFTLPQRYQTYKRTYEAFNLAKKNLDDKIEDCEKHTKLHVVALATIRGPQLSQWIQELNFPIDHENHLVFDLIKEFLQNAGQSSMITQCEQSEVELATLAQQQTVLIRSCLDLLSQYAAVASNYPTSSLEKHRSLCFLKWCQILRETKSVEVCHEVLAQFNSVFAPETANNPLVQQVVSFSYQLQAIVNDANLKLKKSYDRLTAEGIPDSGSRLDQTYIEAKNSIQTFLRLEKGAMKAFECVNITALCALNKRFLMMEQAAASAGDVLMDLHSMDGDWFLDEMHLMSSLVTELSNLIPIQHGAGSTLSGSTTSNSNKIMDDNKVVIMLNCLKTANNIYKGLQELNFNFYTIILPEAMKTIQTEEPSVIAIVNELNDLILSVGCPLSKLIGQLEIHLRFTIMQMDSPQANVQNIVAQLRSRYDAMLHSQSDDNGTTDTLTPGKMLLMGFNGLFDKLNVESNSLISTFNSLDIPNCWKKVDQYREAKALSAPIFKDHTRSVLDDIFLLKRIQTISEFFVLCGQMSCSFKGVGMATVYDDASLNKPIHRFTADYVSRQLLGVTSQIIALALCVLLQRMGLNVTNEIEQRDVGAEHKVPLEELCRKLVDIHLKRGSFTSNVLAQASGLSSTLENSWRRREIARHLQQNVEAQRTSLQRLQLQLTAHYWLHEDMIMLQPGLANLSPVIRSNFMMELRKNSSTLLGMQQRLTDAREQQRSLVSSAEQRLKWAAGANPALSDVMAAFECAVNIREDRLTLEQKLAVQVGNTCSALLHHEALRTRTSEGMSHDAAFIALLNQWEQACNLLSQLTSTISSTEESLMELLPVDGSLIDANWVKKCSNMISDMIATRQQQMLLQSENVSVVRDLLKTSVDNLKDLWNTHHHLMGDIRNLLKSISKNDDGYPLQGLHDYLHSYYSYSEKITAAFFVLNNNNTSGSTEDLNADDVEKALQNLQDIVQLTRSIYDDLLKFKIDMTSFNTSSKVAKQQQRPPLLRQDPIWQQSPRKQLAQPLLQQGNIVNSSGRGQQRNAYAVGVWRRVRMKLEGRDPDPGRRYTLQEQVDYVIREATNLENLALLYEGWTPWV